MDTQKVVDKPKFFSKEWWMLIFTAWQFWRYSARDAAVHTISSWQTHSVWLFGAWCKTHWETFVVPAIEATLAKTVLFTIALLRSIGSG